MLTFKNRDGYPFYFKAMAFASPIEPMPVCPACNGSGKKYSGFCQIMDPGDEDIECPTCYGRGSKNFFAPTIEPQIQQKLQEYLDRLLTEQAEARKLFQWFGDSI